MRSRSELLVLAWCACSCAVPSRAEMQERNEEVRRLQTAHAVHVPKDVESCVGVTLRLADTNATPETIAERDKMAALITAEEVEKTLAAAGAGECRQAYLDAVARGEASAEPMILSMSFGIDPAGRVCAVVERERMEAIDPAGAQLMEASAGCLEKALFRAQFPAGRVQDRERIVLPYKLIADPNSASK